MPIWDLLKPVPSWTAEEAEAFMRDKQPWEYVVLDVRELPEYLASHIPGAIHIPLSLLSDCLAGFDREMPVIVCCAVGGRSTTAAGILLKAGVKQVHNLMGGIKGWKGMKTRAVKGADASVLAAAQTLEQTVALSWIVEDATREFYKELDAQLTDEFVKWAFQEIGQDEIHHRRIVEDLYRAVFLAAPPAGFPFSVLPDWNPNAMEGGVDLRVLLSKLAGRPVREVVEAALAMEANALDIHILMDRKAGDREARKVFRTLAGLERAHIAKILKLLEPRPEAGKPPA